MLVQSSVNRPLSISRTAASLCGPAIGVFLAFAGDGAGADRTPIRVGDPTRENRVETDRQIETARPQSDLLRQRAVGAAAAEAAPQPPKVWIGYTTFRTNLPEGRHANVTTMRARLVRADGASDRPIGEGLIERKHSWTQFAGWSPEGTQAIIGCGWESPENAAWEEQHRTFRMDGGGWLYDVHLVDVDGGDSLNVTAVQRVSSYNSGLFFWPDQPDKLGFTALIDGVSHPFRMNRDGTRKVDLSTGEDGFTYGFNASPDGRRIAYHKAYQIYLADADGSNAALIDTGQPFNFVPQWSPDGEHVLFLSGEHYDCHPHVVRRDGTGLRKLADRRGYRGVVSFLDVFDFHGGSSDVPVWSADGRSIFFTRSEGESVELCRATLDGTVEPLTRSPAGAHNYHPTPSPDGQWLIFGTNKSGARQLELMHLETGRTRPLTSVPAGQGAMWPHWQPHVSGPDAAP